MKAQQETTFHTVAVRMDWLRWLARPVVLLWKGIVRLARWFWSLCVLAWRSLVGSFSYRYWFLAVIGGTIAFFFILYFYFLGIRIKQPNLVLIGTILASLPLGWSMAEIASLIRRKAVTGEEFTISEIRYQLGAGFKAVRMLLKYVVLAVLLVAVQIGMGLIVHIPSVGPALFTLAMVPVIILSVFALGCIILLLFGLAVFPVHVLYTQPAAGRGFIRRQMAEAAFLLRFLKSNFFRLLFGMVPMSVLSVPLFLIPVLVFGGALGVTYLLTSEAMRLGSVFATIPARIQAVLDMLTRGNWDVWGALSAIFVSVSMALLAGMLISLATAFCAGFFFNLYTKGIYLDGDGSGGEEKQIRETPVAAPDQAMGLLPLPEDLIEDEKLKIDDLDGGIDLLGVNDAPLLPDAPRPGAGAAGLAAGNVGLAAGAAGLALGSGLAFSGSLPVAPTAAGKGYDGGDDDDDISGDDLLASIESTMPIGGDMEDANRYAVSGSGEDESLSLMDMDNPSGFGEDISGDDLLASIESTMPIAEDAASGGDVWIAENEDETLSIEDLTLDAGTGLEEDVSNEDILASIESTMPIASGPEEDFSSRLEMENDQLAQFDVDTHLSEPASADVSLATDADISSLNSELDDLLGTAPTGMAPAETGDNADLDALLQGDTGGMEGPVDTADGFFVSGGQNEPGAAGTGDDLAGLDGDLDALLAGSTPPEVPATASDAGGFDDLDLLLGSPASATPQTPAADTDDFSGTDDLDALLGGSAAGSPQAPGVAGDDFSGLDSELDALLGSGGSSGMDIPAESFTADDDSGAVSGGSATGQSGDELAGLDGDLDALLAGNAPGTAPAGGFDNSLDDLLGGTGGGMDAPVPAGDTVYSQGDDLDALLGGAPVAAAPAAAAAIPAPAALSEPFSNKGTVAGYGYLVSVKENNRVYFGIRGKSLPGPQVFTLDITYAGGARSREQVRIDSLDDKGMGYARLDLSGKLQERGAGAVTGVAVSK